MEDVGDGNVAGLVVIVGGMFAMFEDLDGEKFAPGACVRVAVLREDGTL